MPLLVTIVTMLSFLPAGTGILLAVTIIYQVGRVHGEGAMHFEAAGHAFLRALERITWATFLAASLCAQVCSSNTSLSPAPPSLSGLRSTGRCTTRRSNRWAAACLAERQHERQAVAPPCLVERCPAHGSSNGTAVEVARLSALACIAGPTGAAGARDAAHGRRCMVVHCCPAATSIPWRWTGLGLSGF